MLEIGTYACTNEYTGKIVDVILEEEIFIIKVYRAGKYEEMYAYPEDLTPCNTASKGRHGGLLR